MDIAEIYETKANEILIDYFKEKGRNLERRKRFDRIDFNLDEDKLLEVKTRDCSSTKYDTAYFRYEKLKAMEEISRIEDKPCYLLYLYLDDMRFFIANVEELKTYQVVERRAKNPKKGWENELTVEIPLQEKKFYKI